MSRLRATLLALVVGALAVTGLVAAGPASAVTIAPGANYYHPYSDPLWFPFHGTQPIKIGCAGSSTNNNASRCDSDHPGYYAINFSPSLYLADNKTKANPNPTVYSAGAGVVTKVVTGQPSCVSGSSVQPGNTVYVSHGAGIVAVYQHLHTVAVSLGEYVTMRTPLGTVGATGAPCSEHAVPYLDFQVRHWGGSATLTQDVPALRACNGPTAVGWPGALTASMYLPGYPRPSAPLPTKWTQVPWGAAINVSSGDFGCQPTTGGTGSPNGIVAHLAKVGTNGHTLSWPVSNASPNAYMVEFQVKKGSSWALPCSPFATPGCTYGFYTVSATTTPHFTFSGSGSYRVQVYAHNAVGWSRGSGWYDT